MTCGTAAMSELADCRYPLPPGITARIAKMPAFLAEATQPDGNLVQIGDTYAEPPPTPTGATAAPRGGVPRRVRLRALELGT